MRAVLSWSRFYTRNRTAKGESNASGRAVIVRGCKKPRRLESERDASRVWGVAEINRETFLFLPLA